jgi:hypothetical protein
MRNSTIIYPVKMEYGSEIDIFVLKMMMKGGLEEIFLKFLHAEARLIDLLHRLEALCLQIQIQ